MNSRPTIALAMIVKNEAHNLPRLFESIKDCFDEVHITDTGSTDNTIEVAKSYGATVHHFTWIDDFAAARNYSFSHPKTDYIMWMDGDDVLGDPEIFKLWRDQVMVLADYWLVPYWYSFDEKGSPVCTFSRERVIKREKAIRWRFFIHEGMIPEEGSGMSAMSVNTWRINHLRSAADYERDKDRNVSILEKHYKEEMLPPRLMFYYGKELVDKGRHEEALKVFKETPLTKLQPHDLILTYEYWVRGLLCQYNQTATDGKLDANLLGMAFALAQQGIALAPSRAELYLLAGDSLIQMNRVQEALPMYSAAKECIRPGPNEPTAIFHVPEAYTFIPRDQIARIHARMGRIEEAKKVVAESFELYKNPATYLLKEEIDKLIAPSDFLGKMGQNLLDMPDIVITCPEQICAYSFDDQIYKDKGIGGSETACVEVAEWLAKKLDKLNVIVFNKRDERHRSENGVDYIPAKEIQEYFTSKKPIVHIAWRHNLKLTSAPTYLWSHDLMTNDANKHEIYEKIICLSNFHKDLVQVQQGVPKDKIIVSKNGINEKRFKEAANFKKLENKIVFPSSPDRGLDRTINIIKKAREKRPDLNLELHVYYGLENLEKYGLKDLADKLRVMFEKNQWVIYHGNVKQDKLALEMMEAAIWLYPANFIETFCITAIEALSARVYPIVREIGALKDTLRDAYNRGQCRLLFKDAVTDQEIEEWADELIKAIDTKAWEKVDMSDVDYSWESVADHFIDFMSLQEYVKEPVSLTLGNLALDSLEEIRDFGGPGVEATI